MKNYKNGNCYCDKCKAFIGNYFEGTDAAGNPKSYHSLIRQKYCNDCRADVLRHQRRYIQKEYRKRETAKKSVLIEKVQLLQDENKLLRLKVFGTDNPDQLKKLVDLLKTL